MRFLLIYSLVFSFSFSFAQAKDKFIVNMGIHQMNAVNNYLLNMSDEGGYLLKQKSVMLYDVNFLYSKKLSSTSVCPILNKLSLVFGAGFNQKGMNQENMTNTGAGDYQFYNYKLRRNYSSHYLGLSYGINISDKIYFEAGALNNLDIDMESVTTENTGFSAFGLASRTYVTLGLKVCKKTAIQLSPYFQCAFSNYLDLMQGSQNTVNYRPYGLGLSLGLVFEKD